jgi:hypothetical protein
MVSRHQRGAALATAMIVATLLFGAAASWFRLRDVRSQREYVQQREARMNEARKNLREAKEALGASQVTLGNWLEGIAPERGLEARCLGAILGLKDKTHGNRPFFGPRPDEEVELYLTQVYVSRRYPEMWMYQALPEVLGLGPTVRPLEQWSGDGVGTARAQQESYWVVIRVDVLSSVVQQTGGTALNNTLMRIGTALGQTGIFADVHQQLMPSEKLYRDEWRYVTDAQGRTQKVVVRVPYAMAAFTMRCK